MYTEVLTVTAAAINPTRLITERGTAAVTVATNTADLGERPHALVVRVTITSPDDSVELTATEADALARGLIHAANIDPDAPAPRNQPGTYQLSAAVAHRRRAIAALIDLADTEPDDLKGLALAAASGLTGRINGPQEHALADALIPLIEAARKNQLAQENQQ